MERPYLTKAEAGLEIGVGDHNVCKQWFPVVPDHYLGTDVLLGVDVLGQAPMTWIHSTKLLVWADTPYPVGKIIKRPHHVEKIVKVYPVSSGEQKEIQTLRARDRIWKEMQEVD